MTRSALRALVVTVATALGLVLLAPAGSAAAPTCTTPWGSLAKSGTAPDRYDTLRDIRAGRHACFDRLVLHVAGARGAVEYRVAYGAAHQQGTGARIPLRGAADLAIELETHAYGPGGRATFDPRNEREVVGVSGFRTFRQVAWGGSFEGQTTLGLGVRARLPFRVTVLHGAPGYPGGARVVVDVAHTW